VESTFTQAIDSIAGDNRSGAAQIAERAADILLHRATLGEAASPDAFRQELLATGWALIRAQAAMAPLVNLVNNVLWKVEESDTPRGLRNAVAEATKEFKRQLHQHALRVAEGALPLIGEGGQIITLSYSSTVQHALLHAQRAGRRMEVICAETRPGFEGRETALMLASCGVPVTLVVDSAAAAAVEEAQLVLVGADMLSEKGLLNRVGTFALAMAAKQAGVPFYTLCGSEKFMPPGFHPFDLEDGPVDEVWSDAPQSVRVKNQVFDFTPLELITGIVTEQGVLPVEGIEAWLAATKLHPALAHGAQRVAEKR
jgi:translation initiation factor eIF-2B subunit delta